MIRKIECQECGKDITSEVKVYDKFKVVCQDCNIKQDEVMG